MLDDCFGIAYDEDESCLLEDSSEEADMLGAQHDNDNMSAAIDLQKFTIVLVSIAFVLRATKRLFRPCTPWICSTLLSKFR